VPVICTVCVTVFLGSGLQIGWGWVSFSCVAGFQFAKMRTERILFCRWRVTHCTCHYADLNVLHLLLVGTNEDSG